MNTAVSVASLASAISAPSIAAETPANDPIFATIERHKAAFIRHFRVARVSAHEPDNGPNINKDRLAGLDREYRETHEDHEDAAWALALGQPQWQASLP